MKIIHSESGLLSYLKTPVINMHNSNTFFPPGSQGPLIFAGRLIELQFRMSRPLTDFMATLHKNGIEEKKLSKYVAHTVSDDTVTFSIK